MRNIRFQMRIASRIMSCCLGGAAIVDEQTEVREATSGEHCA